MAAGFAVAGASVAAGLAVAVSSAAQFEAAMRNVNSISGLSEAAFKAQGSAVLDLSRQLPQSAKTLAEGLYDIASSGFQGAEGLQVLEESAKAASAGLTTTANSAKAITAVLNAYGRGAEDAADVSDVLFQTVNLGVISFEELTGVIGDTVGAAAAAAGIGIDEVGSAVAAMTLSGISAAEAGTSLNRVIGSLIKPSDAMATVLKSLGYESGHAALQANGLRGTMEKLREATGGNVTTIMELFNEQRAARGAFALMANEGENYRKVSEGITDANTRQGATQRALNEQMKGLSAQVKVFVNELQAGAIEVGTHLLPVVSDLLAGLRSLASDALPGVQAALAALAPFFANVSQIGGDLVDIAKALVANLGPLGQVIAAIVVGGVIESLNALSTVLAGITGFLADHEGLVTAAGLAYVAFFAATRISAGLMALPALLGAVEIGAAKAALGVGNLAATLTTLNGAAGAFGIVAAVVAATGAITNFTSATAAAKRSRDEFLARADTTSLEDMRIALAEIGTEIDKANDKTSGGFLKQTFKAALDMLPLVDTGFTKASQRSVELEAAWKQLAEQARNFSGNVGSIAEKTGLSRQAVEHLAKTLSVDLADGFDASGPARQKIIDHFEKMKVDGREAGVAVKDSAALTKEGIEEMAAAVAAAQKAIDDTAKKVGEVFSSSFDLVSNYAKAAKDHEKATGGVTAAQEKLVDAQRALGQLRERQAVDDKITIADAQALAAAEDKVAEAQKGVAAAQREVGSTSLSAFFAQQVADANKFATDIRAAAEAGLNPAIIKRLLEAGPEQAAPFLQGMLSGHVARNVEMANETQTKLNEVNALMVEAARVTQRAINATNAEMASEYETAMGILAAKAALGGKATADAIAEKLGIGVEDVKRIARDYVIVLAAEVNVVLRGVGAATIGYENTGGAQRYAQGGISEAHVAQIAPGGPMRVWAEPETGGEAYIPLAEAKRGRSVNILREVADRFGMGLVEYHEGGGTDELGLPLPPSFGGYGDQVGYSGREASQYTYDKAHAFAAEEKRKAAEAAAAAVSGGGALYTGGSIGSGYQQILGYLDSKGQDYDVTSTYRPGDPGFHGRGKAVDMVGDMAHIFRTLAAGNPVPGINELFYTPMGYSYDEGSRVGWTVPGHYDHVHAATFDNGGWLQPGVTLAYNGTGHAERVSPVSPVSGEPLRLHPDTVREVARAVSTALQENPSRSYVVASDVAKGLYKARAR